MKRATLLGYSSSAKSSSFNPRPREEGDVAAATMAIGAFAVSIHALVKRATNVIMDFPEIQNVSIHALVKRVTARYSYLQMWQVSFNPRPREEGDVFTKVSYNIVNVSIHALVKRATVSEKVKKGAKLGFNPRPHEEGDHRRYRYFYS